MSVGVWITGCFHEDGLADTLDAFGGGWVRWCLMYSQQ